MKKCEICTLEKQVRLPLCERSTHRATDLLERVFSDICSPILPVSKGGHRYFFTFIDDYIRYVTVYVIREKSEVIDCFIHFKNHSELKLNKNIKVFRSDNGREYINRRFDKYLQDNSISRELSIIHSPQQNSVAE